MRQRFGLATMAAAFVLTFAVVLGGCASTPTGGKGGSACDIMQAIRPKPDDVDRVSIELGRQIVAHNRYVEEVCGVKP